MSSVDVHEPPTTLQCVGVVSDLFGMRLKVLDGKITGKDDAKFKFFGGEIKLVREVFSSTLDLRFGACVVCVKVGKSLFLTAVHEHEKSTLSLWFSRTAIKLRPAAWSRQTVYEEFAKKAEKAFETTIGEPDEVHEWKQITDPQKRCKKYVDLRDKGVQSGEALLEAFG